MNALGESRSPEGVCAVIVTYRPDVAMLARVLEAVAPQVERVVIVDNGSGEDLAQPLSGLAQNAGATLIASGRNLGVGWGHNTGIAWAREHGLQYVLLFDQDSIPTPGMVAALRDALEARAAGQRVAAVGPCSIDVHDNSTAPFVRLGFPLNRRYSCADAGDDAALPVDFLITSGTLIPLAVLDDIGLMNEALFIDNVDMEWCFRAKARSYGLYGVCNARMLHRLGDRRLRMPGVVAGGIAVHSPLRLYYMMRNRVLLYRLPHTPVIWILQDVIRLPFKTLFFGALVAPRLRNLYFMAKGLWHGMLGRSGAYQ